MRRGWACAQHEPAPGLRGLTVLQRKNSRSQAVIVVLRLQLRFHRLGVGPVTGALADIGGCGPGSKHTANNRVGTKREVRTYVHYTEAC